MEKKKKNIVNPSAAKLTSIQENITIVKCTRRLPVADFAPNVAALN